MAKITIEDCLDQINNHFKLVLIASQRARQLQRGAPPKIDDTGEKPGILALREIAAGLTNEEVFDEPLMQSVAAEEELAELIRSTQDDLDIQDSVAEEGGAGSSGPASPRGGIDSNEAGADTPEDVLSSMMEASGEPLLEESPEYDDAAATGTSSKSQE